MALDPSDDETEPEKKSAKKLDLKSILQDAVFGWEQAMNKKDVQQDLSALYGTSPPILLAPDIKPCKGDKPINKCIVDWLNAFKGRAKLTTEQMEFVDGDSSLINVGDSGLAYINMRYSVMCGNADESGRLLLICRINSMPKALIQVISFIPNSTH